MHVHLTRARTSASRQLHVEWPNRKIPGACGVEMRGDCVMFRTFLSFFAKYPHSI